jgi:seryl-tRNA synthetase
LIDYRAKHGVFQPSFELSEIERSLFREFEDLLRSKDFKYLAVPESISTETFHKQAAATNELAYWLDGNHMLNGSAEQGVLDYFANCFLTEPMRIYAFTHCFRRESKLEGLVRLKEFKKIEQFVFCREQNWREEFDLVLHNATDFLVKQGIEYREVDVTKRDLGYHKYKIDIEIKTKTYGWVESHSCTYFGNEQCRRLGITGVDCTISNTGISSPRILIPLLEKLEGK